MINLSQFIRESSEVPMFKKFQMYFQSETYISENISDFNENAHNIVLPWHRKFSKYATLRRPDEILMMFYDVGLREIDMANIELTDFFPGVRLFELHDESGSTLAQWGFSPYRSFEQARSEEGLKEEDFVHNLFATYSLKNSNVSILDVTKDQSGIQSEDKGSLVDRVGKSLRNVKLPRIRKPSPA